MQCEAMEARRLLTATPWFADIDGLPMNSDEFVGAQVVFGFRGEFDSNYRATDFDSAGAAEEALAEIAVDYWSELFGEEISPGMMQELGIPTFRRAVAFDGRNLDVFSRVAFNASNEAGFAMEASNVRVPGIDQADFAELIDERLIVVAHDQLVSILDVSDPEDITLVNQLNVGLGVHQFLTNGNELIVVSTSVDPEIAIDTAHWNTWHNRNWDTTSQVRVFDLSDPNAVTQTSWIEVAGTIQEARLQNGRLMLSTAGRQDLPPIEFVQVEGDDEGQLRFETEDEYLARVSGGLVSSFVGQMSVLDGDGGVISTEDLGGYEDLQILDLDDATWGPRHSSLVMLEIEDGQLSVVDSEVLVGFSQSFGYANDESHFAVNAEWEGPSRIVALGISDDQIDYRAEGQVDGIIRSSHAMDEQDGYLRVFTTRNMWGPLEQGADVWVLSENEGELEVVGELRDLAEGQGQFGSVFMGDVAYVTTAEFDFDEDIWIVDDPLHIIDFSDPTNPVEQSELDIPGVARFLRRVDETHLLGIGFELDDEGTTSRQVTLYDVSDAMAPQVVSNWVGEDGSDFWTALFETQRGSEMNIRYLPERGLLTIDGGFAQTEVFQVDVDSSEPIQLQGVVGQGNWRGLGQARSFVLRDYLVLHSHDRVATYPLADVSSTSDEFLLQNPLPRTFYSGSGTRHVIRPLDNPGVPSSAQIISARFGAFDIPITISEDGRALEFESPQDLPEFTGEIEYEWRSENGQFFMSDVWLWIQNESPVNRPVFSDATVSLGINAVGDAGDAITEVAIGDRVWIELTADREGFFDDGVFSMYFDVEFDTSVFEVLELEHTEPYRNGMRGEITEEGIREFGGFAGATQTGAGPNRIARFQVEVIGTGDLQFRVSPNQNATAEVLVYGENERVNPENVNDAELTLNTRGSAEGEFEQTDVNHDGITTALDALILVNALNANRSASDLQTQSEGEFSMQQMDVNGDSLLTPLDVLQIINELNAAVPEGEMGPAADDAIVRVDQTHHSLFGQAMESGLPSESDLDALAATQFLHWDIERRG